MIIFINGPFGIGKTTIAEELRKRISNSMVFDPEEVGFFLKKIIKENDPKEDFQDYPMWRSLTVDTCKQLLITYNRVLIVPMTIWKKEYFQEIVKELQKSESNLYHFCLIAPIEIVKDRLLKRGDVGGSWPFVQSELCIPAFQDVIFKKHIDASSKSMEEIVEEILLEIKGKRGHIRVS